MTKSQFEIWGLVSIQYQATDQLNFFSGTFCAFNETDVIRWEASVQYTIEVFVIDAQRFLRVGLLLCYA